MKIFPHTEKSKKKKPTNKCEGEPPGRHPALRLVCDAFWSPADTVGFTLNTSPRVTCLKAQHFFTGLLFFEVKFRYSEMHKVDLQ